MAYYKLSSLFELMLTCLQSKYFLVNALHFTIAVLVWKYLGLLFPEFLISCYHSAVSAVIVVLAAVYSFDIVKQNLLNDKVEPDKSVFITGCDSGFGHNLAKRLDSNGFQVFAGCQFPSGTGATELKKNCSARLQIVEIDVTKDKSVNDAVKFVNDNLQASGLWAIVNNAGIQKGFTMEVTSIEEFIATMDVNAFGPVRMTKAFLPLLKETKGRVVNVTSLVGRVPIPGLMPYVMSKYAATAFNDCLRQEIDSYGIHVITVEPELFQTSLTNREEVMKRLEETFSTAEKTLNEKVREKHLDKLKKQANIFLDLACPDIEIVVDDLESAVSAKYPGSTYNSRRHWIARLICFIYEVVPTDLQILLSKMIVLYMIVF